MFELKPCPFCGWAVSMVYNSLDNAYKFYHKSGFDAVDCCVLEPIVLDGFSSLSEAGEAWNRRAENVTYKWDWNENKLPKDGEKVLAYCGWNGDTYIAVRRNGKWYLAWDNVTELRCISHWMPLPANKPNSGEYWRR